MRRHIENLKQKSERTRKHISLAVAGLLTLAMIGVWSLTIPGRLAELKVDDVAANTAAVVTAESPFDSYNSFLDGAEPTPEVEEANGVVISDTQEETPKTIFDVE